MPRSLFGQVVVATVLAVVVSQLIGAGLLLDERAGMAQHLWGEAAAQRIASFIKAVDESSPQERLRLATGIRPGHATLDEPWLASSNKPPAEALAFLASLKRELAVPLELQILLLDVEWPPNVARGLGAGPQPPGPPVPQPFSELGRLIAPGAGTGPEAGPDAGLPRQPSMGPGRPHHVVVQARLTDGSILTLRHVLPPPLGQFPLRVLLVLALVTAIAGGLAAWTVRRLTAPLGTMAKAAAGLANNLEQAPLPERGPVEVATAAASFNRMQRELKRMLDTRSQALAAVSHDLRLPITRIRLRIERVADDATREAIDADLVEMDRMIGETLEFLRAGASGEQPARIDVGALVESIVEDMRALGCEVQLHGGAAAPLLARGQALRRCLGNVVDNARRYGGAPVDLTVRDDANAVLFVVEDRGPGIPESERERVFEPFVRLESSRARHTGGTGLGLAIARAIARGHGGDAWLEAREGGGLRVVLSFPRAPSVAATAGSSLSSQPRSV